MCTSRRRRHRGLPSACAWRPHFHAISGQLVLSTRRSWSKSISPITCKSFPKRKKMTKKTKNADRNQRENCNLETRIPFMETGHTVRPPCAHRGSAGAAAGITRVRHAHILTCDTLTRARDRRSRARRFGARGPRQTAMGVQQNIFSRLEKQENKYGDTCCAGAVRPRAALFAWRIRESCTRHVVTKTFAAQTWRIGWVNRAHGADLGEDAARGPVTCCVLISSQWAFSQTMSSCFHKRDSCFQFNMPPKST